MKHLIEKNLGRVALLTALVCPLFNSARAAAFTPGDLAMVVAAGSGSNTNCSVVEINTVTAGQTAVQTIAIPGAGANAIRVSGSATSTLYVSDSNDGSLLCFNGVNLNQGTGNVTSLNPRAVVTLDASGNITIPTTYAGATGNQTRCATTLNNSFWYIGDQGGFYTNGTTAAVTTGNIRSVKAFGGAVYSFAASASVAPVNTLTASGAITALPGLPAGASSMQDFYLISSGNNGSAFDVLYIFPSLQRDRRNHLQIFARQRLVDGQRNLRHDLWRLRSLRGQERQRRGVVCFHRHGRDDQQQRHQTHRHRRL